MKVILIDTPKGQFNLPLQKVDNRNVDKNGNDVSNAPVIIMGMTPKKALEYINKEKDNEK